MRERNGREVGKEEEERKREDNNREWGNGDYSIGEKRHKGERRER